MSTAATAVQVSESVILAPTACVSDVVCKSMIEFAEDIATIIMSPPPNKHRTPTALSIRSEVILEPCHERFSLQPLCQYGVDEMVTPATLEHERPSDISFCFTTISATPATPAAPELPLIGVDTVYESECHDMYEIKFYATDGKPTQFGDVFGRISFTQAFLSRNLEEWSIDRNSFIQCDEQGWTYSSTLDSWLAEFQHDCMLLANNTFNTSPIQSGKLALHSASFEGCFMRRRIWKRVLTKEGVASSSRDTSIPRRRPSCSLNSLVASSNVEWEYQRDEGVEHQQQQSQPDNDDEDDEDERIAKRSAPAAGYQVCSAETIHVGAADAQGQLQLDYNSTVESMSSSTPAPVVTVANNKVENKSGLGDNRLSEVGVLMAIVAAATAASLSWLWLARRQH